MRYEYKVESWDEITYNNKTSFMEDKLNEMSRMGWEYVNTMKNYVVFRRPVEE